MMNKGSMKVLITILVLLSMTGAALFAGGKSETSGDTSLADVQAKGYFVLGLDDSFPPMGYRGDDGEIVGFDIDLARAAAEKLGVEVQLRPVDWDGVILSLKKGDIDVVWNGMTITESRKEQIAFSKPYIANRQIVVVQEGSSINSKADLSGKVVGLQMGSSSEVALNSDAEVAASLKEVKKYSNNIEALLDLQAGRSDAVVVDEIVGRYYIAKRPGIYRVLSEDFGKEEYGVGIRKEDVSFREALDAALDAMREDGIAADISKNWFGEDIVLD